MPRKQRIDRTVCVDCEQPAFLGQRRCEVHREIERQRAENRRKANPKRHSLLVANHRNRRIASGLCTNCKLPALPNHKQCEHHRQMARDRATRHVYNLSPKELTEIRLAKICALCGGEFHGKGQSPLAPHIDHDHRTGKRRGVIHKKCNVAIGMFHDRIDLLFAAISYLKTFKEEKVA